jgi:hypothetical protein
MVVSIARGGNAVCKKLSSPKEEYDEKRCEKEWKNICENLEMMS